MWYKDTQYLGYCVNIWKKYINKKFFIWISSFLFLDVNMTENINRCINGNDRHKQNNTPKLYEGLQ